MGIDTQTMEQTFAQYGRTIYRLALQYTRQPPDAEDVLQEVLLERCRRTEPFQSPEHERRWLLRVAVNKSRNLLRAGRRRPTVPLDEALAEYAPAEPSYRALYEAVLSLPRDYRLTVDLYYYEGYSTGEIAALLGAREATVRTWLRRAKLKLKELLKEEWDDDQP